MPYHAWVQFRRQRNSVGLSVALPDLLREFPLRPLTHSLWNNHDTYSPADVSLIEGKPAWVQNNGGIVSIHKQGFGLAGELTEGIRNYGALLESIVHNKPRVIRGSAGGAVIHDRKTDRLYYAASRWLPGLQIHMTLTQRVQQLPIVQGQGGIPIHTLVPSRHAHTCAEFQALNQALWDGAQENDLDLWSFKATTMEPFPRCPNCRVTAPRAQLANISTC
jgi:hypothetical protein